MNYEPLTARGTKVKSFDKITDANRHHTRERGKLWPIKNPDLKTSLAELSSVSSVQFHECQGANQLIEEASPDCPIIPSTSVIIQIRKPLQSQVSLTGANKPLKSLHVAVLMFQPTSFFTAVIQQCTKVRFSPFYKHSVGVLQSHWSILRNYFFLLPTPQFANPPHFHFVKRKKKREVIQLDKTSVTIAESEKKSRAEQSRGKNTGFKDRRQQWLQ